MATGGIGIIISSNICEINARLIKVELGARFCRAAQEGCDGGELEESYCNYRLPMPLIGPMGAS